MIATTSRLLIAESPMQVLPSLACAVGLNEALILQQIHYWAVTLGNERDGRRWVYNSYPQWQKQFPFWSVNTVRRAIEGLERRGLLITSNYNTSQIDRTKWYSVNYEALDALAVAPNCPPPSGKNAPPSAHYGQTIYPDWAEQVPIMGRPIPETNAETNTQSTGDTGVSPPAPARSGRTLTAVQKPGHGTPLPADFPLTAELRAWAAEKTPGLDIGPAHEDFCDYWHATPGSKGLKRDWPATWRHWMREQVARAKPRSPTYGRPVALPTGPPRRILNGAI